MILSPPFEWKHFESFCYSHPSLNQFARIGLYPVWILLWQFRNAIYDSWRGGLEAELSVQLWMKLAPWAKFHILHNLHSRENLHFQNGNFHQKNKRTSNFITIFSPPKIIQFKKTPYLRNRILSPPKKIYYKLAFLPEPTKKNIQFQNGKLPLAIQ